MSDNNYFWGFLILVISIFIAGSIFAYVAVSDNNNRKDYCESKEGLYLSMENLCHLEKNGDLIEYKVKDFGDRGFRLVKR